MTEMSMQNEGQLVGTRVAIYAKLMPEGIGSVIAIYAFSVPGLQP